MVFLSCANTRCGRIGLEITQRVILCSQSSDAREILRLNSVSFSYNLDQF